jgi:ligand-binding sensor protein
MLRRSLTELLYYAFTCQHLEEPPKKNQNCETGSEISGKNIRRDDQGIINIEDLTITSPAQLNFRTGRS